MMYVKLLFKDMKSIIKHNKILFSLIVIGLFFISLLSLLLCEVIRSELISINRPQKKAGYLCYKYEEPQNADTVIDAIGSIAWDSYSLYMITSTALNNNPFYYDIITDYSADNAPHKFIYNSDTGAGIVGYKRSKLSIKNPIMSSGEFFSEKSYKKPVAVITKSVATQITDNNTIIAEDHTFEILGILDSESTGDIAFISCNILTPIDTFRDLGLKASIVFIEFQAKPSTKTLNKITESLDALGKNTNTAKRISTFSWNVIFQYFLSSLTYIAVLVLLFAILLLTFKC